MLSCHRSVVQSNLSPWLTWHHVLLGSTGVRFPLSHAHSSRLSLAIYVVDVCMKVLAEAMNNVYHISVTLSPVSLLSVLSLCCAVRQCSGLFILITSAKNVRIYFQGTMLCTGFGGNNDRWEEKVSSNPQKIFRTQNRAGMKRENSPCLRLFLGSKRSLRGLHCGNHRITKLAALDLSCPFHQAGKIVGYALVGDSTIHPLDD